MRFIVSSEKRNGLKFFLFYFYFYFYILFLFFFDREDAIPDAQKFAPTL